MDASRMSRDQQRGRVDVDDVPVGGVGPLAAGQRWSVARKRAVVLRLIAGEPEEQVSREIGVPVYRLERWRERAEAALKGRDPGSEGSELAAALQRIGELTMEVELLRAKMEQKGPLGRRTRGAVAVMAGSASPATGRAYGVAQVCKVWGVPRSSFYLARRLAQDPAPVRPRGRRGPKPSISDAAILEAFRADLARSPWSGEGHRKVWARLQVLDGLKVARKRVLRLMRAHNLLSLHRARPRPEEDHDRPSLRPFSG